MTKLFIAVYNTEKDDSTLQTTKKMAVEKIRQFLKNHPESIVVPRIDEQKETRLNDDFNEQDYANMLRENLVWLEKKQNTNNSFTPVFDELADIINQGDINVLVLPSLNEAICCPRVGLDIIYLLTEGRIKYLITNDFVLTKSDLEKVFEFIKERFSVCKSEN